MSALIRILISLACVLIVVVSLFVVIFRDRRSQSDKGLCDALETGNTNYLQQYLASGGNANGPIQLTRFERGNGPLLDIAIQNGQLGTVGFLLGKGANPNQRDSAMHTPLEWAIGGSKNDVPHETRVQIFKRLLQAGADPNVTVSSEEGYTPLFHAAFLGESEMVSILLATGVSVNATNHEGLTALNFASNAEVARLLLAAGADRTAHAGGETPAESAIRFGHFSAFAVLTNAPPETNAAERKADN
jgi:ankyrin repeat protein